MKNIFILSMPRSGSSMLANLLASSGFQSQIFSDSKFLGPSEFNEDGYFEEVGFTLLNDQLIRAVHGMHASFVRLDCEGFVPPDTVQIPADFDYDINQDTLFLPADFENRVKSYTGNDWDNWGLTRMQNGGKWHRCYAAHGCRTGLGIASKLAEYKKAFANLHRGLVIKDPRLAAVFFAYEIKRPKVIIIRREADAVIRSMRSHYGPKLFTGEVMPGSPFCSNHFNYKVKPISFDRYSASYENLFDLAKRGAEFIEVSYEHIRTGTDELDRLEAFCGVELRREIVLKEG